MPTTTTTNNNRMAYTTAYCLAYVAAETLPPLFGPALEPLSKINSISVDIVATCPSILSAGSIVGGLVAGSLLDRNAMKTSIPRSNTVLMVGLVLSGLFNAPLPFINTLSPNHKVVLLVASTLCLGMANGLFRASANTMILRVHEENAGPYMQALHLFGGAGRLLAPLMLSRSNTLKEAYAAASLFPIVACMVLMCVTFAGGSGGSSEQGKHKQGMEGETKKNTGSSVAGSVNKLSQQQPQKGHTSNVTLFTIGGVILLFTGAQSTYQNQISFYASTEAGFSSEESILLSALFGTAFTVGRILSVPLSIRCRPRTMILFDAIGVSLALILMASTKRALWYGTALFGVSMASMFPSILNFAKQTYRVSGSGIGLIMQMGSVGAILVPLIVVGTIGTSGLFTVLLPMSLTALSLFVTLPSSNVAVVEPVAGSAEKSAEKNAKRRKKED
jgi:FHS family Na+ dependent glucose MFS transporter 1